MTARPDAGHCPTCHATWGPITAYTCDGPPEDPHPRVRTVAGPPPAPPTVDGRELALDVDPELEPMLAALYGPTWRRDLAGHLAGQLTDRKDTAP